MFDLQRFPFDQYQRYRLVQEIVESLRQEINRPFKLLDVGGYFRALSGEELLPLKAFLPDDQTVTIDLVVAGHLPGYVRGSGLELPFAAETFDLVISCDTLEHIPAEDRPCFLATLLRVSKYGLVLAAPFNDPAVATAEAIVLDFSKAKCQLDHPPLQEHRLYGLPDLAAARAVLNEQGYRTEAFPTGYLTDWLLMMLAKQFMLTLPNGPELNQLTDYYYNRTYHNDGQLGRPNYRTMLIAAKQEPAAWLDRIRDAFSRRESPGAGRPDAPEKMMWLVDLFEKISTSHEQQRRETRLEAKLDRQLELTAALLRPKQRHPLRRGETWLKEKAKRLLGRTYAQIIDGQQIVTSPLLVAGLEFKQIFRAEQKNLTAISLPIATYQRLNTSHLSFQLYNQAGRLVAGHTISQALLLDMAWFDFEFNAQIDSAGQLYTLVIASPDGVLSDTVSLLLAPQAAEPGHELRQNNRLISGKLRYTLKYV